MIAGLSSGELVVLVTVGLLAFGGERMPEVGRAVGNALREFHRALNEARDAIERDAGPPGPTRSPGRPSERPGRRLSD